MKFTPRTREEIIEGSLMKEGVYEFNVFNAEDAVSPKAGAQEYIKLTLHVFDDSGRKYTIFDNLFDGMKLIGFCESTGLNDQYKLGEIKGRDCFGKQGLVHIKLETGKENPKGGVFKDKNVVKEYLLPTDSFSDLKEDVAF